MKENIDTYNESEAYKAFLRNYKEVARFTLESLSSSIYDTEVKAHESEMSKPYTFDESEFYSSLYVERSVEEVLKRDIRITKDYLCFVGPRGAGKTTVGKKIQRDLKGSKINEIFMVFLDIRFLKANLNLRKDRFLDSLKWQVMVRYFEDLFPLDHDSDVFERLRLWEYLLQPALKSKLPQELRAGIYDLQFEANVLLQRFRFKKSENKHADLYSWLKATHLNKRVSRLTEKLEKRIEIAHLVYAAKDLCNYDKQVIWFDNTDALPDNLQPEVIDLVKAFHRSVSDHVSTIVAIREENIFRDEDPFEEPGAPPYRKRVKMRIDRDKEGNPLYGLDIPIIKPEKLSKLIEQRLELARIKQKKYHDDYEAKLNFEMSLLDLASTEEEKERILKRVEEYQKYLSDYQPLMSSTSYKKLRQLSKEVMSTLQENMLIYLTNSSLRDFLFIHRDVLIHVIKNARYDIETALSYPQWYLSTLFYHWLASTDRDYHVPAYNIVRETENWIHDGKKSIGCILSHLIITTIWNLTIEKAYETDGRKAFGSPTISEVASRLVELGYKKHEIIDKLYNLHIDLARGSIVEFRLKGKTLTIGDLKDTVKVYLTYRGRCLASLSCNTFGYFYQNIQQYIHHPRSSKADSPLEMKRTTEYAEQMLPYLCDIAQMHYDTFKKLRAQSSLEPRFWFNKYCEFFGTPQKEPYKRSKEIGIKIKGIRRALQFEALISGLVSYAAGGQIGFGTVIKDKMQKLQNKFAECVEKLSYDGEPPDVDFRLVIGLSPR